MESAMTKIRCKFIVADFLATDLSVADLTATKNSLLTISNGLSVAHFSNGFCESATDSPLLIHASIAITNGESVGDCICFY